MRNCRKIQRELSAYLDGELTSSLRAKVEEHLASCADCQQELLEMKTLAAGVAALPNLKPAPQFLTEVRRKIARGEKPEALAWQDYIFRPIWLKVPLEVAALIIIGLVIKGEHPAATQQLARLESTAEEKGKEARENNVTTERTADSTRSTPADQTPAAEPSRDVTAAQATKAEPSPTQAVLEKEEKDVAVGTSGPATASDEKRSLDQLAVGGGNSQPEAHAQKTLAFQSNGALSATPQPSRLSLFGFSSERASLPLKAVEMVTVHGRDFEDVRSQAQRLAVRCGGQVVGVPSTSNATGEVFFVELPKEYVAAFKVELMKSPGTSALLAAGAINEQTSVTNLAATATGVLTGGMVTNNNSFNAPRSLRLGDDATITAPTTILEIRVIAPVN